jgi:electron transfer flavoprotein alpha subunit
MPEGVLLVMTRPPGGGFAKGDHEAFAVASQLASSLGASLSCAVIGEDVEGAATEAAERGATRVLTASGPAFGTPGDGLVAAATAAAAAADPAAILVPRGPDMLELTPRLAARRRARP